LEITKRSSVEPATTRLGLLLWNELAACTIRDRGDQPLYSVPGHFFPGWATANLAVRRTLRDRTGLFAVDFLRGEDLELACVTERPSTRRDGFTARCRGRSCSERRPSCIASCSTPRFAGCQPLCAANASEVVCPCLATAGLTQTYFQSNR
jgi:hypothetical protein